MAEIRFRDGVRVVPEHVEALLSGIPCDRLTYDQAMHKANMRLLYDHLERVHGKTIQDHFRRGGT